MKDHKINSQFREFLIQNSRFPEKSEVESIELANYIPHPGASSLKSTEEGVLYIDVSHTLNYPYNSGIQRVVRSLVFNLNLQNAKFELFKFNDISGQPVKLTPEEVRKFYDWKSLTSYSNFQASSNKLLRLAKSIKKYIPNFFWNFSRDIYFKFNHLIEKLNTTSEVLEVNNESVLDLSNRVVLLPEVTTEIKRIEMIETLSQFYETRFSAIVYDLIPITHPEYCTIGYDFVHYLRIFRYIDQAICISKYTESELTNAMKLIDRRVSKDLRICTSYLGGEFNIVQSESDCSVDKTEKMILMVARFEPRKNIRKIAKAINQIQLDYDKDLRFVIVGNPGWLQEEIISDLNSYINNGAKIEYHFKLPDEVLVELYQKAYFTVFCSIVEGLGLPIIESILFGKPCVTANSGSQAEVADRLGGCYKVDRFNIDSIKSGIRYLLENKDAYEKLKDEASRAKWETWPEYSKEVYDLAIGSTK